MLDQSIYQVVTYSDITFSILLNVLLLYILCILPYNQVCTIIFTKLLKLNFPIIAH